MHATTHQAASYIRRLRDVGETSRLAETLSRYLRPGDVIGLGGDLGLGKTTLARALINALAQRLGAPAEEVPSPTFTLVQVYELPGLIVSHFDLYRIERPEEIRELGLADAIADGVVLIEWPERLGAWLPADRLDVVLGPGAGPDERIAEIAGHGEWAGRLAGIMDDDLA